MGCAFQTWPKPIKFVREGKEQQQWILPKDSYKEESSLYSYTNEYQALHKCSRGDWVYIKSRTIHFLPSQCSSFRLFPLFPPLFSMLSPFLIYLYLHHIFTLHFYLTSNLFWHLLSFSSKEDGWRNLLNCYTIQVIFSSMRLIKLLSII